MAPTMPNAMPADTSFSAKSIADLLSYSTRKMTWNATLPYYVSPSTLSLVAPSWTICTTACFCWLRNVSCVAETAFASYAISPSQRPLLPATDLLTSCAFMTKSASLAMAMQCHQCLAMSDQVWRCLVMSRDVSRSLFSQLPYWCLARRSPVPVEPAGNQTTI